MKILLVDDEETVRRALFFALQKKGHQLTEAAHPVTALEILKKERFDLLILDYRMSLLSGLDVAVVLRRRGSRTPVILLSSQTPSEEDVKRRNNPIYHIISKDNSILEIIREIEKTISNSFHSIKGGMYA